MALPFWAFAWALSVAFAGTWFTCAIDVVFAACIFTFLTVLDDVHFNLSLLDLVFTFFPGKKDPVKFLLGHLSGMTDSYGGDLIVL